MANVEGIVPPAPKMQTDGESVHDYAARIGIEPTRREALHLYSRALVSHRSELAAHEGVAEEDLHSQKAA